MVAIIRPILFILFEILLSIFKNLVLGRKTGVKSPAPKNDSRVTKYSTISPTFLNLSGPQLKFLAACMTATILPVSNVSAAEVFTKDQGLEGSVVGVTAEGLEFQTIYGKGAILIQWSDIEMIRSDKEFLVLYGEAEEAIGRIWGLENGELNRLFEFKIQVISNKRSNRK